MDTARKWLLRSALMPLVGIALTFGCGACAGAPAKTGTAGAGAAGAGAAQAAESDWQAYDSKAEAWVECLRTHGWADARYQRQHNSSVFNARMELVVHPDGSDAERAIAQCKAQEPTESDRPLPYLKQYVASPEERKQQLNLAKCVRERGFSDYPDPDPDPNARRDPGKYDKGGVYPEFDKAMRECVKQLGVPEHVGG